MIKSFIFENFKSFEKAELNLESIKTFWDIPVSVILSAQLPQPVPLASKCILSKDALSAQGNLQAYSNQSCLFCLHISIAQQL